MGEQGDVDREHKAMEGGGWKEVVVGRIVAQHYCHNYRILFCSRT